MRATAVDSGWFQDANMQWVLLSLFGKVTMNSERVCPGVYVCVFAIDVMDIMYDA